MTGKMVISLDFELFWGVLDKYNLDEYGENILNVSKVIPKILELFEQYEIHATWGIVGLILLDKKEFLEKDILKNINYKNKKLSAYGHMEFIKNSNPNLFFAENLVKEIKKRKNQEIATHTLSHYFVSEEGQTKEDFDYDMSKMIEINKIKGNKIKTIIFPKNQNNNTYNTVLQKYGIKYYRGNEKNIFYKNGKQEKELLIVRIFRFLDSYINIGGNYTYQIEDIKEKYLLNVRASRLFRPYNKKMWFLEFLKIRRIKKQMEYAAKHGEVFHLWWHPHNFGKNLNENLILLENLLNFYKELKNKYNFKSYNICEIGEEYENTNFGKK